MNDDNHRASGADTVDAAFAALRSASAPEGPTPELVAATIRAVEHRLPAVAAGTNAVRAQRRRVARYLGYGSLATAAVAAVLMVLAGFDGGTASLARAFENVRNAEAVRFRLRTTFPNGEVQSSDVTVSGNRLRVEGALGGDITWIIDWDARGAILVRERDRACQTIDMTDGGLSPFASRGINVREELLALRDAQAALVGAELVNGETADHYRITGGKAFYVEGDWEIWVGRHSGLPVKVSVRSPQRAGLMSWDYDSFDWTVQPEAGTFSIDPPPGFTETSLLSLEPPLPPRKK